MIFKFDKDKLDKERMLEALTYISEENQKLKVERDKFKDLLGLTKRLLNSCIAENQQLKDKLQCERMLKFRLGDRVSVYPEYGAPFRGTIFNMHHDKIYVIEDGFYSAHSDNPFLPSQCRKLRRVKK